ncbi:sugar ABC transporter substrate-binding protein [Alkalicoccobacillus murimartini]|uniref:Ribose transport system substrate-binding protein n=1 Tax=Alkalicoccobacillus murimartini TaxID=171685 RepID=A0ABT9YHM5_9BACI|nr:sugar ABC transporter substrate-binding protein [Alkalicoccobacillus murimartini]MDQ0207206.1 ribose transport system substrate-binding protein [Alkalicoccobacillus murimartini]
MKSIGLFLIGICVSGLLVGCSTTNAEESTTQVTVVLKTLSSEYWQLVEAGAMEAGKELGIDVRVTGPSAESEIMDQVNLIEDGIVQQPDAFVIAPIQPSSVVPALERAYERDIPVLLLDTDVEWDKKTSFVGTDNYSAGQAAGKLMLESVEEGDEVALITGMPGNTAIDSRIDGAVDVLEENGVLIAARQSGDSDKSESVNVASNILQRNPEIKGIYAASDDMAIGAYRAVNQTNLDIPVIGTDGNLEATENIIAGGLSGTIAQSPYDMGYQSVIAAAKAASGQEVEARIPTEIQTITEDSAPEQAEFIRGVLNR